MINIVSQESKKCPQCGFDKFVFVKETGEVCCSKCGFVLKDRREETFEVYREETSYPLLRKEIDETFNFVTIYGCCPNCSNDEPKQVWVNWPKEGFIQCGVCRRHFPSANFILNAELVEHPIKIPNICINCGSIHIKKEEGQSNKAYIFGYELFRLECLNCGFLKWFAVKSKRIPVDTWKGWFTKKSLSSFGDYKQRFKVSVEGPVIPIKEATKPHGEFHYKVITPNKEEIIIIPNPRIVRHKFRQIFNKEKFAIGYTKSERTQYLFERQLPYHWAFKLFENNKLIYEECLRLAQKLIHVNKRGKVWDYLALAVVHIALFLHRNKELMPNFPELWKKHVGRTFHWKTYIRHLSFAVAHTQPYIRNGVVILKNPEVWVKEMLVWADVHQPIA